MRVSRCAERSSDLHEAFIQQMENGAMTALSKGHLRTLSTIALAFALGAVVMLAVEAWRRRAPAPAQDGLEHV